MEGVWWILSDPTWGRVAPSKIAPAVDRLREARKREEGGKKGGTVRHRHNPPTISFSTEYPYGVHPPEIDELNKENGEVRPHSIHSSADPECGESLCVSPNHVASAEGGNPFPCTFGPFSRDERFASAIPIARPTE